MQRQPSNQRLLYLSLLQMISGFDRREKKSFALTVNRIDQQRMAEGLQMHANLMLPAGLRLNFEKSDAAKSFQYANRSYGGLAVASDDHYARPVVMRSQRTLNGQRIFRHFPFHQRQIRFLDLMLSKLPAQLAMRRLGFGEQNQPARARVNAMHHKKPDAQSFRGNTAKTWPIRMPALRNYRQAGRFVESDDHTIIVQNRHAPLLLAGAIVIVQLR